jgi:ankyrin repeat protein
MHSRNLGLDALAILRMSLVLIGIALVTWYWDDLADVLAGRPRGETLLFVAAGTHDLEALDRALAQGANINTRNDINVTPLFHACDEGDEQMVRELLKRGADVTVVADAGLTPLRTAIVAGNPRVVEMLLNAGADPNARSGDGSMLDLAEEYRHPEIAMVLRSHGARHAMERTDAS